MRRVKSAPANISEMVNKKKTKFKRKINNFFTNYSKYYNK